MKKGFLTGLIVFALFVIIYAGATNYDRLVLGSGNYGTDPNTTADITLQNDEYISNSSDGQISFGAANLLTTGTIGGGVVTGTGFTIGSAAITEAELEVLDGITGSGSLTAAELLFVDGVTSAIQTQLNAKAPLVDPTFTNIVTITDSLRTNGIIVGANAETLSNATNGYWTSNGYVNFPDSSKGYVYKDSGGKQWLVKVRPSGVLFADSTGLN